MDASIVIANRNGFTNLCRIMQLLDEGIVAFDYEIVIVDIINSMNLNELYKQFRHHVMIKVIKANRDDRIGDLYNRAFQISLGKKLLFLNDNVQYVKKWVEDAVLFAALQERSAVIGITTNNLAGNTYFKLTGYNSKNYWLPYKKLASYENQHIQEVGTLCFEDCYIVNRQVFKELGGFDEHYVLENWCFIDLCLKSIRKGYHNYAIFNYSMPISTIDETITILNKKLFVNCNKKLHTS